MIEGQSNTPAMLKAADVAAWLSIPTPTVYEYARRGILPSVRVGKSVRFSRDQIAAWIEKGGAHLDDGSP